MPLDYADKYDLAGEVSDSILGTIKNTTLATATDVVATLYNSLPFVPEARTEDMLAVIDQDALAFFNQNSDTVRTMSMIGGAFIPGGVSLKLLGRARAGLASVGYVDDGLMSAVKGSVFGTRQKYLSTEISRVFAESGEASAQYKALTKQLYQANILKEVADNVIVEAAIVGSMNAHPYMEDYLKDPLPNFMLGVGIGGVIGTAFAVPTTRRAIIDLTSPIKEQALFKFFDKGYQPIFVKDHSLTESAAIQRHNANIQILDDILLSKDENPLTKEIANTIRIAEDAQRAHALRRAAPWTESADETVRAAVLELLSKPEFQGVDKIRFYDLNKSVKETAKLAVIEDFENILTDLQTKHANELLKEYAKKNPGFTFKAADVKEAISKTFLTEDGKPAMAFVRLSSGEMFAAAGARNVALAVDIKDIKTWLKTTTGDAARRNLNNPVKNFAEDNLFRAKSTAQTDADFLHELKTFDGMTDVKVPYITIAPDHLPRQNAYLSWLSKQSEEVRNATPIFIKNQYATHSAAQTFLAKTVSKDYEKQVVKLGIETDMLEQQGTRLRQRTYDFVRDWISGSHRQKKDFRDAFEAFFRNSGSSDYTKEAEEIWRAGEKTRQAFRKIADADGFVYLYRGIYSNTGVRGSSAVESYATTFGSASGFASGKPNLHKVHVDNIIGSIANQGEHEILVAAPHHQIVNQIPVETPLSTKVDLPVEEQAQKFTVDEFYKYYADETERQIQGLIASKIMSFEEISARTNTKLDAVKAVSIGAKLSEYPAEWRRYTDAAEIDSRYLDARNKLYAVLGNPSKNQLTESITNLDAKQMRDYHQDFMEQSTMISRSRIANDALELFAPKEMKIMLDTLYKNLSEINNVKIGDVRFQSADQALRNIKDGPLITYIGKQIVDKIDKMKEGLLQPLASSFRTFADKPEMFAEFNKTYNKLLGMSGWREIKIDEATGYGYIVQRQGTGKNIEEVPVKNADGTTYYIKQQEVLDALNSTRTVSGEMLRLHNLIRHITGKGPVNDIGFWMPPPSLVGKNIAMVFDNSGQAHTKVLIANNKAELEQLISSYKKLNSADVDSRKIEIVTEGQRFDYNLAKNYVDYADDITYVDSSAFKTGSLEQAITPSDDRFVNAIMQGYDNAIVNGFRRYTEMYLNDTMAWLDKVSEYYQRSAKDQPKGQVSKESVRDGARAVKNILLGRDQLESSVSLKKINTLTDVLYNRAASAVNATVGSFSAEKVGSKEFFDNLNSTLRQKGIDSPWQSFDEYLATTVAETRNIAPHIQSAGNGLLATLNLRMFEVAQAAINVMSLPILTWSALMERLPGTKINETGSMVKLPMEIMMNGMRHMFSEEGKRLTKLWEDKGLIKQTVRQYTEVTATLKASRQGREFMDKALDVVQGLQTNKIVKDFFSKPADWAEEATRKYAMHTGFLAAKQAYPGIDDTAATVAATAFADRTIGNYHAAQRPALFQGTFGAAIGLYQTYMLTYMQSIYRSLENKNLKQLGSLAMAQSALFGMASWPGYHLLSEQVVGNISDQHIDLTTGTYRAIGDDAAKLILYGLPSSIGPAFYTRGDVNPRVPSTMGDIAIFNGIKQGWAAATNVVAKTSEGLQNGQAIQSMLEALSLQSMNRPIARWAELVSGSSITQQGNTVSPAAEVWTPVGIASRLIGTRPIQEQVVRNAVYLNRYYESLDHDRRAAAVDKIATAVRNGKLTDTLLAEVATDYVRFGGNAKGWRSALNEVLLKSEVGTRLDMLSKLEANSPLNRMLADLY